MRITSSYAIEIKHMNKIFQPTIKIYREALSFCIDAFEKEWDNIEPLDTMERRSYVEKLMHSTKSNQAKYQDFDKRFYKMPQFMRLSVYNTALGYLSSYHSQLDKWYYNGCKDNMPVIQKSHNKFPTFYKPKCYQDDRQGNAVRLKLFIDNDWKWVTVHLKRTDLMYIYKHLRGSKISNPTLERHNKKWFLRFAFEEEVNLTDKRDTILAVDLGINTDAVCSVMKSDGTILVRKFINFASNKDYLNHTLNKIKKVQQKYGSKQNTKKLWRIASFKNEELARKIAKAIVDFAVEQNVDVIVCEHLDITGKIRGSKKQILHLWKKKSILAKVEHKAHKKGMRYTTVCAWNTSALAYDGSGKVLRGKDANLTTYSLCKFPSGKIYNCDLSASYNIGARYFIREIQKSTSAKKWSDIQAQVPECEKRVSCTYNTFKEILRVL